MNIDKSTISIPSFTINTMPEGTLKALARHSKLGEIMAAAAKELLKNRKHEL